MIHHSSADSYLCLAHDRVTCRDEDCRAVVCISDGTDQRVRLSVSQSAIFCHCNQNNTHKKTSGPLLMPLAEVVVETRSQASAGAAVLA
jgi:hypothetical protein